MRGEFVAVWSDMWRHVWKKLADHRAAPDDLFCELYRELNPALVDPLDPATDLAAIVDDVEQARVAFRSTPASAFGGELVLVDFLERAHVTIVDFDDVGLTDRYFALIKSFVEKYSLRYDLRRPFSLHPTLPGVFARLMRDLKRAASADAGLSVMMNDFDDAIRDLKRDQSSGRIRTCIQKEITLLEAIAQRCPGVTAGTLGAMCGEVNSWPHAAVKDAVRKIYGFTSDYPGIRHAGTPASALREIDMRDLVALSIVIAGFTPYLTTLLDSGAIYRGGT